MDRGKQAQGKRWHEGRLTRLAIIAAVAAVLTAALLLGVASPRPVGAAEDDQEMAFLAIINDYRAASGLGSLSLNTPLGDAARWMSTDMATKNYWPDASYCAQFGMGAHCDSLGRDPFQRMASFGYTYNTWKGENLVAGADTAQGAFELWRNSPGHNANMLRAEFTVIGIARVYGAGSAFGWYWTTEFGGQGEPVAPAAPPPPAAPAEQVEEVVQTAAPAQATAPAAAPEATPDEAPEPAPPPPPPAPETRELPRWQSIASDVSPWLAELGLEGSSDSILRAVSYVAERYLVVTNNTLVLEPMVQADQS